MRRISLVICLATLASACSYSHVGPAIGTFNQPAPPLGGPLMLKISRHVDTVIRGPDDEEDQLLVLEVRDVRLNQRLTIPSPSVKPEFTVTRFGPSSKGESFNGYLIVRKITAEEVQQLRLDLQKPPQLSGYAKREWSGRLLRQHLEGRYGIKLSARQCQRLLHRLARSAPSLMACIVAILATAVLAET